MTGCLDLEEDGYQRTRPRCSARKAKAAARCAARCTDILTVGRVDGLEGSQATLRE
jgi:hypothetical protein